VSQAPPTLGIELRFWPNDRLADWDSTFAALWSWDPDLRPQAFHVASGEGSDIVDDRPWDPARLADLVRLCADRTRFSWFMGNDSRHFLQCRGRDGRISIGIQIPVPTIAIADHYLDLIARMPSSNRPELGLLFNYGEVEPLFEQQGLRRLAQIAPILHLGPHAVETLGGDLRLRQAPCEVRDAPGNGLLLIVRPYPFPKPNKADRARMAAVAAFLGMSEETPLVLKEP
jgi:hypothetical protein